MKAPSVSEAYAMIRVLKDRNAKGDGEKIAALEKIIADEKTKTALLAIDKYFGTK